MPVSNESIFQGFPGGNTRDARTTTIPCSNTRRAASGRVKGVESVGRSCMARRWPSAPLQRQFVLLRVRIFLRAPGGPVSCLQSLSSSAAAMSASLVLARAPSARAITSRQCVARRRLSAALPARKHLLCRSTKLAEAEAKQGAGALGRLGRSMH